MNESEIATWFNLFFWPSYPADLTHQRKGAKSTALKAFLKLAPDEKQRAEIMSKLEVLVRADRSLKKVGKEPLRWPYASTWINQERWQMVEDMESTSRVIQESLCSCGERVDVKGQCQKCYFQEKDKAHDRWLYETAVKCGHPRYQGEPKRDWVQTCREWAVKGGSMERFLSGGQK